MVVCAVRRVPISGPNFPVTGNFSRKRRPCSHTLPFRPRLTPFPGRNPFRRLIGSRESIRERNREGTGNDQAMLITRPLASLGLCAWLVTHGVKSRRSHASEFGDHLSGWPPCRIASLSDGLTRSTDSQERTQTQQTCQQGRGPTIECWGSASISIREHGYDRCRRCCR